jgi:hypothetical protein
LGSVTFATFVDPAILPLRLSRHASTTNHHDEYNPFLSTTLQPTTNPLLGDIDSLAIAIAALTVPIPRV